MDMRQALRKRQIDDPAVSALVGNRVTWVTRPQASALPAVTMQTINDERPQHLKGFDDARGTRVQIDCWARHVDGVADGYAQTVRLAEAVIAAVINPATIEGIRFGRATIEGQRDLSEDKPGGGTLYRQSLDIRFWHEGA
ncbi:DUF3168 domain-containing protein [Sphingomonas hankookensis]|uniref:DUF3168 domain-containing protein n=1 Tax=Sphingomonas hankookensis TaxID=563996 RepID=A0ABR5YDG1_9SPHN|nr:DUF3168 domain-containing protein [Sphingomonas hankookensis]KZE16223.1 hypothetical protein AVT10_12035 [Sphingomonas hankookensis]